MAKNQNSNTRQATAAPAVDDKSKELDPAAQLLADQAAAGQATLGDQANLGDQSTGDQQAPATPPVPDAPAPDEGAEAPVKEMFRVGLPLSVLIVGGDVDIKPLLEALGAEIEVLGAPAGLPSLEELATSLPTIVARYADNAKNKALSLEDIVFTVADPATDATLRTINFMRSIQGLGQTHIYPDILSPQAAE